MGRQEGLYCPRADGRDFGACLPPQTSVLDATWSLNPEHLRYLVLISLRVMSDLGRGIDRERFNYSAVSHSAPSTLANYAVKLIPKHFQPGDAALDLLKLMPSDAVCSLAGMVRVIRQTQKLADDSKRKP